MAYNLSTKEIEILPPDNKDMKILNKEAFKKTFKLLGVKVPPNAINLFIKKATNDLFNQPRYRNVLDLPEEKPNKLILFKIGALAEDLSGLSEEARKLIKDYSLGTINKDVEFTYDYWTSENILRSILPNELPVPSSFSTIGFIAHFNLRDEYLPYKNIIGQVILDKNPHIRTVINKTDIIDAKFRNFEMELLAGEPNFITTVKESGCKFELDFSKVYWNPRLHTEHERINKLFKTGDFICDVMAGIGPFAIPSAKRGQIVYCNDLNPVSYDYLLKNIKLNKLKQGQNIIPFNLDGRDFIRKAFLQLNEEQVKRAKKDELIPTFHHVVMNLPASAIEFLDAFRNIFTNEQVNRFRNFPKVHVHCFSKEIETPLNDLIPRASKALGRKIHENEVNLHHVRKVAPNKDMYCFSFSLTAEDLCTPKSKEGNESINLETQPEPPSKKSKIE